MRTIIFIVVLSLATPPALCADGDAITCTDSASNCQMCIEAGGIATAACYTCKDGYALTFTGPADGTCTRCPAGQGVEQGRAINGDPAGQRSNKQPMTPSCQSCYPDCAQCLATNAASCTRCNIGKYANSFDPATKTGTCNNQCGYQSTTRDVASTDLTAVESFDTACVPCAPGCERCRGTGTSSCLSCKVGFYVSGFTAASGNPMYPNSYTPTLVTCSPCDPGTTSIYVAEPTGTQDKAATCLPCHPTCAECAATDANSCKKCAAGRYAFTNVGMSPDQYRAPCESCTGGKTRSVALTQLTANENPVAVCTQRCHASCESCVGPNDGQCTRCAAGYYLSARTGTQPFGTCTACTGGKTKDADRADFTSTTPIGSNTDCTKAASSSSTASGSSSTASGSTASGTIGSTPTTPGTTTAGDQPSSKKSAAYLAKLLCGVAVTVSLSALL